MSYPFDVTDASLPSPWSQFGPVGPSLGGAVGLGGSYGGWPRSNPAVQTAYDFWFGPGQRVADSVSSPRVFGGGPGAVSSPIGGAPSFDQFSGMNWGASGLLPNANGQFTQPTVAPSLTRLPYGAAAGGMWEGLAKELELKERANGLPTDGLLGSFAYLPTSNTPQAATGGGNVASYAAPDSAGRYQSGSPANGAVAPGGRSNLSPSEPLQRAAASVDEARCEAQYAKDVFHCRMVGLASCYAQAAARYAACLRGDPLPPLSY